MKKVIAFDLDGTLAPSKSALPDLIAEQIRELLSHKQVCVISGGKFAQFEIQLIGNLQADSALLHNLHIMPTCGTRYLRFDDVTNNWKQLYAEDIEESDKKKIIEALEKGIDELGYREAKPWGDLIEDRGSQITFSALGQEAPVDAKEEWDPDGSKKLKLRNFVADLIPQFEVRAGGSTSIDITKLGIDKAYGMHKLMDALSVTAEEILFVGDRLSEGGNDYPVKAMGIDCVEVESWKDTKLVVETINKLNN